MQALHVALAATVAAGDEVLIPDPGWPNFAMAVGPLQARPVRYPLRPERDFVPDLAELEALVTPRTRAIIVNTPSHPLGAVLPAAAAQALCRFADDHDLWLVSDECYDAITFDAEHVGPGRFDREERVLSCFSFSKTYAMTGMRVGYLLAPPAVAATAAKIQEALIACVNARPSSPPSPRSRARRTPSRRCGARTRGAAAPPRRCSPSAASGPLRPRGAFYLWIDVRDRCGSDVASWALDLLRREGVAVAPRTAFGPAGESWNHTSLATAIDELLEGLRRIVHG